VTELLRQILAQQPLDERNRAAFFSVVSTIGGAYERHRVLSAAIASQRPSDPALIESALGAASTLHSDYETSMFLQEILRQNGIEGSLRAPFFAAVNAIPGHYERASVLRMVVKKSDASQDTLRAVLQSARVLDGYDLSQLLQLVASTHPVSGDVREAYLNLADRLAEYEQGQAMAALVRAERAERRR